MEPTHHGSDRDIEILSDFLVRQTLDIAKEYGEAIGLGQGIDCRLHVSIGEVVHELVFGAAGGASGFQTTHAAIQVEVLDAIELGFVGPALLGPIGVDVGVGVGKSQFKQYGFKKL